MHSENMAYFHCPTKKEMLRDRKQDKENVTSALEK